MRIALCADGRSPHTQRWANGLVHRGHDVAVVWLRNHLDGADFSNFDRSISHHEYTPPSPLNRFWMLPVASWMGSRLGQRLRPDLVHGLYLSGPGWTAHSLGMRPLVLSALGSDVLDLRRRGGASFAERAADAYDVRRTRAAVAAADIVFADSLTLAAAVREHVPGTKTLIVRFGVDLSPPGREARSKWRQRLGIADDAFVLLSSRLVHPTYNIDTIIRALPEIRRRLPQAVLVLKELPRFSDLEYRSYCLGLLDELDLREAVRLVGELEREELLELHAAADVYVSVPERDGTSVSVLEAMAACVPVVATDAPGIDPEILQNDKTAQLVRVRDPDGLASAVIDLGLNAERRRILAEHAHDVVRRFGEFDRELDRAVAVYHELVAAAANSRLRLPL
jgi:glycosyltransferase involved in cell wall biosynthesis